MGTINYVEVAAFAAVRGAIESVPRQLIIEEAPNDSGLPADEMGRWTVEPGSLAQAELNGNYGTLDLVCRMTGYWTVSDMSPAAIGPMVRDVRKVIRAVQSLGCVSTSEGTAGGWRIESANFRPGEPAVDIDVTISFNYTREGL